MISFGTVLMYGAISVGGAAVCNILNIMEQQAIAKILHVTMTIFLMSSTALFAVEFLNKVLVTFL